MSDYKSQLYSGIYGHLEVCMSLDMPIPHLAACKMQGDLGLDPPCSFLNPGSWKWASHSHVSVESACYKGLLLV